MNEPLPLLVSVPHAGLEIPPEVAPYCILGERDIRRDGDEGAAEIYHGLRARVAAFVTTRVARAIVDMNRAEDDIRNDGVVKTHTCWEVPIYRVPLPAALVQTLIARYHRPYHEALARQARRPEVAFGVDCHTMAEHGPPVGPDAGEERPLICLGNANGSCSRQQLTRLAEHLEEAFQEEVSLNKPFSGGYIVRSRPGGLPWVQLELSRTARLSHADKAARVQQAFHRWSSDL